MTKLLDALKKQNKGRPPIWLYRQAGRYMPQYQLIKKNRSLNALFLEPELIVKTTLLPIQALNVDAAILFADILTVFEGLNVKWHVEEGIGPVIETKELGTKKDPNEAYTFTKKAIIELKRALKVPLIGFAGGPFTVACYLVEGKISKDLKVIKKEIYTNPERLHQILEKITDATIDYLNIQIDAGVDAIQLFDSWAGFLSPSSFDEFSLRYLKKVMQGIKKVPITLFCRGSSHYAKELGALKPDCIGFDWQGDLKTLSERGSWALQGNLDPLVLFGTKEQIKKEADKLLSSMKDSPRYIFNLGHGILPETPYDNVKFLVDYVRSAS